MTTAPPPTVLVREVRETPPAELTRCLVAPRGLPETGEALIPTEWRAAITRLAAAYREAVDRHGRLSAWTTGEACPAATAPETGD